MFLFKKRIHVGEYTALTHLLSLLSTASLFKRLARPFGHARGGSTNIYSYQQNTVPCTALPVLLNSYAFMYISVCTYAHIFKNLPDG